MITIDAQSMGSLKYYLRPSSAIQVNTALSNQAASSDSRLATAIAPSTPLVSITGTAAISTIRPPSLGYSTGCFNILALGAWTTVEGSGTQRNRIGVFGDQRYFLLGLSVCDRWHLVHQVDPG